ncbi:MAG: WecB/TagA/CpsF family glycosyltransferase [Microcystaceae cyanobacterium]
MPETLKICKVFDLPVHLSNDYALWLTQAWQAGQGVHVVTLNSEMVMLADSNPEVGKIIREADLVIPDGAGVTLYLRRQGEQQARCPGIELCQALVELAGAMESPPLMVFYGGQPGVTTTAANRWQKQFPRLEILSNHGFLKPDEQAQWLQTLKEKQPQIIFVGLGVPRQEVWIREHRHLCPNAIWVGVGGSFDVWSGQKQRAPKWFCDNNLEWFYRLYQEPWRWKRMLVLPQFLLRTLRTPKANSTNS